MTPSEIAAARILWAYDEWQPCEADETETPSAEELVDRVGDAFVDLLESRPRDGLLVPNEAGRDLIARARAAGYIPEGT